MNCDEKILNTKNKVLKMFKEKLYNTCDGKGLTQAAATPEAHSWLLDGSRLLSGREYITAIHMRYNTLFNRSRVTRGRNTQHQCSRGCNMPETLNHIIYNSVTHLTMEELTGITTSAVISRGALNSVGSQSTKSQNLTQAR